MRPIPWLLKAFVVLTAILLPIVLVVNLQNVISQQMVFDLLRLFLTTCAFVGALWAVYLKDSRLRSASEYVLVSLLLLSIGLLLVATSSLFSLFSIPHTESVIDLFCYFAIEIFTYVLGYLVHSVFV